MEALPTGHDESFLTVGRTRLHLVAAGPASGRPVLLLHGFPEFWWCWRRQMPVLADAGFRVVALDMRGYGQSDAPADVSSYQLDRLVDDIIGVADALGWRSFDLVGHDWGGIVAWAVAARHPGRISKLVVLDAPHLDVMHDVLRKKPSQLLRSAYVGFFQLPLIPEAILSFADFRLMRRAMTSTSREGTFSNDELDRYATEWARPGRLRAMLNYYRALLGLGRRPLGRIVPPTLILWGRKDHALDIALARASLALCSHGELAINGDATHWIHREEPQWVNANVLRFLGLQADATGA
jgi:pimeloyl-ACP methyl ester carboxylesterase